MTTTQDLGWLLANFADRVPGVAHAVAVSADQAVSIAECERPEVVLMDIRLVGERDGIDAAHERASRIFIE